LALGLGGLHLRGLVGLELLEVHVLDEIGWTQIFQQRSQMFRMGYVPWRTADTVMVRLVKSWGRAMRAIAER
jgi:hypothetical protein